MSLLPMRGVTFSTMPVSRNCTEFTVVRSSASRMPVADWVMTGT